MQDKQFKAVDCLICRARVGSRAERVTKAKGHSRGVSFCFGDPYGNRTHVSALRGPRLSLLTNGPCVSALNYYSTIKGCCQGVFAKKFVFFEKIFIFGENGGK